MALHVDRAPAMNGALKIFAVTMARNDGDIIDAFLNQANALFDKIYIADVQSTDGTREVIDAHIAEGGNIRVVNLLRQEKYQSAITNCLAREAVREGADWVYFLDVDEFLNVKSRTDLEDLLRNTTDDVIYMRWINLVPEAFGSFAAFNATQQFRWRGRTSQYTKVALSSAFMINNPEFYVHEGSHGVSPHYGGPIISVIDTTNTLLHIPIRSIDRFKYKMRKAYETLMTKHNRLENEGRHVTEATAAIAQSTSIGYAELAGMAAHYGDSKPYKTCDPVSEEWPVISLPSFVAGNKDVSQLNRKDMTETLSLDRNLKWTPADFPPSSQVCAILCDDEIVIRPQPITGGGRIPKHEFALLESRGAADFTRQGEQFVVEALVAALMKIKFLDFSAWTELIPTLFALFSIARPRRYVELGTHNGVSFFAACQASKEIGIGTECIAIDNWIGDPHASFHSNDVFTKFSDNIGSQYPNQFYIRANFRSALDCFQDKSIDLLHIDGYHTYDAVKDDFDTWLPKMSEEGVIIFHDINVHNREFGVWRFWRELTERYLSFTIHHCHGLGILSVGSENTRLARVLKTINDKPLYQELLRTFLQMSGTLAVDLKQTTDKLDEALLAQRTSEMTIQAIQQRSADIEATARYHEDQARQREEAAVQRIEEISRAACIRQAEQETAFDLRAGMFQAEILHLRQQVFALKTASTITQELNPDVKDLMFGMKFELIHLRQQLKLWHENKIIQGSDIDT